MGLIEEILVRPKLRQKLWAWWYPFFTRRVRAQGIDFLNYAFHEDDAPPLVLAAADELNRPNIQLYEHARGDVDLRGRRVLGSVAVMAVAPLILPGPISPRGMWAWT